MTKMVNSEFLSKAFVEILKKLLIAVFIIIFFGWFVIKPFFVDGPSMLPSFNDKDFLIVDKLTYKFTNPQRGDVVLFDINLIPDAPPSTLIKRIIGLPGETIKVGNNEIIIFNQQYPSGFKVNENYLGGQTFGNVEKILNKDEYFIMGDNRNNSEDSRIFGPIQKSQIIGIARLRLVPFATAGIIKSPKY